MLHIAIIQRLEPFKVCSNPEHSFNIAHNPIATWKVLKDIDRFCGYLIWTHNVWKLLCLMYILCSTQLQAFVLLSST